MSLYNFKAKASTQQQGQGQPVLSMQTVLAHSTDALSVAHTMYNGRFDPTSIHIAAVTKGPTGPKRRAIKLLILLCICSRSSITDNIAMSLYTINTCVHSNSTTQE